MSFSKQSTDRIPAVLGGGFDWSKVKKHHSISQTSKPTFERKYMNKPLITSFLGYSRFRSKKTDEQVFSSEAVSVKSPMSSPGPNQSTPFFVQPTLEN